MISPIKNVFCLYGHTPMFRMGLGYLEEKEVLKDYEGLASLLRETKLLFKESGRVVTLAYYPDTRQVYFRS